jgi:hypothetical protein
MIRLHSNRRTRSIARLFFFYCQKFGISICTESRTVHRSRIGIEETGKSQALLGIYVYRYTNVWYQVPLV